jgi:hypothetical protein
MKKFICLLLASMALLSTSLHAQTRTKTTASVNQGQYIDFGGLNMVPSDSLAVTDSLAYIIPITHLNDINAYQIFRWKKSGAGTATVTVNYFQGNDPTYLTFPVPKGVALSAYTKSFTLSTDSTVQINLTADTALISGRYLKVQFITSATASVKGYIANRLKTNVK